ncbi:MAG: alpha/beta hydrolase [Gemmatimonadetes bacterium]|nr:alpha/beta hydrolase [Gemmatimonadota bacterium]
MSTAVLLLPGMSLNATIFPPFGSPTTTIDFSRLVLGPDGSSPDLLARRMGVYADLLDRALERNTEWRSERRIIVAHSFGGMLAMSWWLAHGGEGLARVDGMVLCSTTAGPLFQVVRFGWRLRLPLAPTMRFWNLPVVTRIAKRVTSGGLGRVETVNFRALPRPTDTAIHLGGWRNTDWRAMRSYRLALDGFDVRKQLGKIKVPVIVLHGDRDPILPPDLGRELADRLPNGVFRLIEGAGHGLPVTHGGEVQRAVSDLRARAR